MVDTRKQVVIHVVVDAQSLDIAEHRCGALDIDLSEHRCGALDIDLSELLASCVSSIAWRGEINIYLKEKEKV